MPPAVLPPARVRGLLVLCLVGLGSFQWLPARPGSENPQHIEDVYSYSTNPREAEDLVFVDSNHGWILVSDHLRKGCYLYSTDDGGKTWSGHRAPGGLYKLAFESVRLGWGLQMPKGPVKPPLTKLLRTETGGETWTHLTSGGLAQANREGYLPVALGFASPLSGWIAAAGPENKGLILQTDDGGVSTHRIDAKPQKIGAPLGMVVRGNAVWVYGVGFALCSQDGGKTWTAVDPAQFGTVPENFNVSAASLSEGGRGWLVGNTTKGTILATEDSGMHWKNALQTTEAGRFDAVSSWDEEHACAIEGPTLLYCTANGGASWNSSDVLPKPQQEQARFFLKMVMLASGRGWALRAGGYLYNTCDGGRSWNLFDPGV